ncbi:hypothetical protein QBS66_13550 [Cronobacter sakazakii]|uniref:hypothetical protein n=1 Tax=Cronobacter sakazakii TaxID=28141 RepID=UPI00283AACC7|nr:hypothetical protein [Cronobacter sakazakii]ELY4471582.1 hypothetical protein [Cronobacter sakazakii]WMT60413.1 hypothetical protein QBS66_13550 [Cronobacter sakazakii]
MSELSKERLENYVSGRWYPDADYVKAMARELLALRERAEPVYQLWSSGINQWVECDKGRYEAHAHVPAQRRVLYTAPPAPVVADETFDEWSRRCEIQLTLCHPEFREVAEITWNACRAEMLTAPPAPVVPEWTNQQCLEFLAVAFRHAEIKGDFELDDLRLGVKMANAMTTGKEG